jgi:hypothetical protein
MTRRAKFLLVLYLVMNLKFYCLLELGSICFMEALRLKLLIRFRSQSFLVAKVSSRLHPSFCRSSSTVLVFFSMLRVPLLMCLDDAAGFCFPMRRVVYRHGCTFGIGAKITGRLKISHFPIFFALVSAS